MNGSTLKAFYHFTREAEERDVSWSLSRQAGYYIEGQHTISEDGRMLDPEEIPDEYKIPLERGYQIEVAGQGYASKDGEEMLYKTLEDVLIAGLQLLYEE